MAPPELCVIFNPAAGRDQAARRLASLRQRLGNHAHFVPTQEPGHALDLARQAALDGCRRVVAAGGDGTAHEVANGLLLAQRPDVSLVVFPIGSANDYAFSLETESGALRPGSACRQVDVGLVRVPGGREKFFVCCLGLGLNGAVTLEARRIKWLQGVALYGLATLRALWYHYGCPQMEITFDDQPPWQGATLMLSVLLGRREGGFVLAPEARLDDGLFDYVHAGRLSRLQVLRLLPRLALAGPPRHHPRVRQGQCRRVHLTSEAPLTVHIDGEFFCRPEDRVRTLEIQIIPGGLRVESALPFLG
jgi:diacylglycerol kinase family enzyme